MRRRAPRRRRLHGSESSTILPVHEPNLNSLKIAYIVPGFSADETDWCIPVLTNFVRRIGQDLEAVVFTPWPARGDVLTLHGAAVHYIAEGRLKGPGRLMYWRAATAAVREEHAIEPFDIVHAFWGNEPGYVATRVAGDLKIPSVVSLAGGELARFEQEQYGSQVTRRGRWLVRNTLGSATLVTTGSPWIASRVPKRHQKKTLSVPLGVDTDVFTPGEVRMGHRLLAVASMIPLKDYPTMLHAVAMARAELPELQLEVAGDGVERERIQHIAHEFGLYGSIRFRGTIPYEQMPRLYHRCDLLVHTSMYEAEGMAVLEALATGMPVVATDVGIAASLPDRIVHRVPVGDAHAIARSIVRSLHDPIHAELAHEAGPQLMQRYFSLDAVAERFLEIYRDLCR